MKPIKQQQRQQEAVAFHHHPLLATVKRRPKCRLPATMSPHNELITDPCRNASKIKWLPWRGLSRPGWYLGFQRLGVSCVIPCRRAPILPCCKLSPCCLGSIRCSWCIWQCIYQNLRDWRILRRGKFIVRPSFPPWRAWVFWLLFWPFAPFGPCGDSWHRSFYRSSAWDCYSFYILYPTRNCKQINKFNQWILYLWYRHAFLLCMYPTNLLLLTKSKKKP